MLKARSCQKSAGALHNVLNPGKQGHAAGGSKYEVTEVSCESCLRRLHSEDLKHEAALAQRRRSLPFLSLHGASPQAVPAGCVGWVGVLVQLALTPDIFLTRDTCSPEGNVPRRAAVCCSSYPLHQLHISGAPDAHRRFHGVCVVS